MNLQYLGDSKDAFKWDYLDFLARKVGARSLHYVSMLVLEEKEKQGSASPHLFPASNDKIIEACVRWQRSRRLLEKMMVKAFHRGLRCLPQRSGGDYVVCIHKPKVSFSGRDRKDYFSGIAPASRQIVFVDPDTGFEPGNATKKHVWFSDIETIWQSLGDDAIVVVFQNKRRLQSFCDTYNEIQKKLSSMFDPFDSTRLLWNNMVMFVVFGKCREKIQEVRDANDTYKTW